MSDTPTPNARPMRYDMAEYDGLCPAEDGDWVQYDDYATIERELAAANARIAELLRLDSIRIEAIRTRELEVSQLYGRIAALSANQCEAEPAKFAVQTSQLSDDISDDTFANYEDALTFVERDHDRVVKLFRKARA